MNLANPTNLSTADAAPRAMRPAILGDIGRWEREPLSEHDKLVEQARTWVGQTFFGTLLKQMRESPFKSELFSGGSGGQAFSQLHDQRLAEHMARGAGTKLVNAIVRRIEANTAYAKQQGPRSRERERAETALPDGRRSYASSNTGTGSANHTRSPYAAPARRP